MGTRTMPPLDNTEWKLLIRSLEDGKCIVVLGPDAACDDARAGNGEAGAGASGGGPACESLTRRLSRQLAAAVLQAEPRAEIVAETELTHVAQLYERHMKWRRSGLEIAVQDFYSESRERTTELHQDLAALPISLFVTTSPDRFLLNALELTPGKKPIVDFYHFQPPKDWLRRRAQSAPPPETGPEQQPMVYGLYGSIEEPSSLVLSENDLLEFLVRVVRDQPPLHPYVASRFADPNTPFLFIGFGFRHWHHRVLLHVLKAGGHKLPSLAIEGPDFLDDPGQRQTVVFYQGGHGIDFRSLPWSGFTRELRRRYEESVGARPSHSVTPVPDAGAPVAFLCHESRDKGVAESLAQSLRASGIEVWLDKQNLRGGDDWPKAIPRVLEKQANYVVVLQSPRMLDKPESYFLREIDQALERQKGFQHGLRFVVPTLIEADRRLPLPQLEGLHFIDLTKDEGRAQLTSAIREDWERRQAMKSGGST